jgi:ketosteroid isomerase-like protein
MAERDIQSARRGYALLNEAYRAGDVEIFRPHLEAEFDPEVVFEPAGVLPETQTAKGIDGLLRFTAEQMKAFADGSMWLEPLEYIDAGDRVVVPYRFGGRARHTELDVEWEFVHVFTQRHGKCVRIDVYTSKAEALADLGLADNVDVVRNMFEAFNRGGVEAALPYFDPEIEWLTPDEWLEQHLYKGYDGLRKLASDWGENFDDYRLDLERAVDVGDDRLVVLIYQRGRIKGEDTSMEQRIGCDWQLRDGKGVRVQAYFSWEDAMQAVGLED